MPVTTILNKSFQPYDIFTMIAKDLIGLKRNKHKMTLTGNINVIFDGELFNYQELLDVICINETCNTVQDKQQYLFDQVGVTNEGNNFAILIIYLYKKYGMDQMLQLIDGTYNFILFDMNLEGDYSNLYIINDPFGTTKMYMIAENIKDNIVKVNTSRHSGRFNTNKRIPHIIFTNNLADMDDMVNNSLVDNYTIKEISAGTYYHYNYSHKVLSSWEFYTKRRYYVLPITRITGITVNDDSIQHIKMNMKNLICASLEKRLKYNKTFAYKYRECGVLRYIIQEMFDDSIVGYYVKLLKFKSMTREANTPMCKIPSGVCAIFVDDNETSDIEHIVSHMLNEEEKRDVLLVDDGIDDIFGDSYTETNDLIEFDHSTRLATRKIMHSDMYTYTDDSVKIYNPFFDKDLLQYYFSIPLKIRFNYRKNNELFGVLFIKN